MKNTEKYFYSVAGFIKDMTEINANHDKEVKRLEPFKGSDGYNQGMREAQAQREDSVRQMRETYLKQFREVAAKMRDSVSRRPLISPTTEQTALLGVLQMRQSLGRNELERAAQQMDGCSVALAALDDLAQKHKVRWVRFNRELTADDLRSRIDTLERAALELIQEGARSASRAMPQNAVSRLEKYGCFSRIPKKGAGLYGDITSANLETDTQTIAAFCDAVNG